jgi:hypothetical protein
MTWYEPSVWGRPVNPECKLIDTDWPAVKAGLQKRLAS